MNWLLICKVWTKGRFGSEMAVDQFFVLPFTEFMHVFEDHAKCQSELESRFACSFNEEHSNTVYLNLLLTIEKR